MIFLYDPKIWKKNLIFASGMAFWPEILLSDLIKVAVDQILIKFELTGAIFGPGGPLAFRFSTSVSLISLSWVL